jgi:metal-responsive CopG/Arc/MetJ family transcriptional regulator
MKVKTSITLSADVLREIDRLAKDSNRSEVIEGALRQFLAARERAARDELDRRIYAASFDAYDALFEDVLSYAAPVDLERDDGA